MPAPWQERDPTAHHTHASPLDTPASALGHPWSLLCLGTAQGSDFFTACDTKWQNCERALCTVWALCAARGQLSTSTQGREITAVPDTGML